MYADDDFQKSRRCSFPLQKTTVLKLSSTLLTQKILLTLCFSHQQNIPSLKNAKRSFALLSSHLLYSYPSQHLSLLGSFPFSTEIPSISMGTTRPIISLARKANSLASVFSLLHHQESIWIHGGLQGTQTKAQNGPTTLPKTDLELMRLIHVGFGFQNYQNQCFTPADSMNRQNRLNRLNRMPTGRTSCKEIWKFERMFLEEWGIHEKKMVCNSEFEWGSYDQNKPKCSEPQHAPINSN